MIKRKTRSSRVNIIWGHREGTGGAGAELSGPLSLPWGTVFSRLASPHGPHSAPCCLRTSPTPSASSVAAGDPGGPGRRGAAGGLAASPAEGAPRLPPGPTATLGQCGGGHPGVPEVPGGPRAGLDRTLRDLSPSDTSCSGLVTSSCLITSNSCSCQ